MMTRRGFGVLACTLFAASLVAHPGVASAANDSAEKLNETLADLEERLDARIGVTVLDMQTGRRWEHRANERFPMTSTFKALACGAVLARVDAGQEALDRRIHFDASDLVTYSPVTQDRVGGDGMTLEALCEATVTTSDNTAGNLILESLGGPSGVTEFARSLGDSMTRLDRWETELNEATPGDPRDTTTPGAMADNLHALLFGERLSKQSRDQLTAWLVANTTGGAKLRAGLPTSWRIGDKTGGGENGTTNDVAVIWPPGREPLIVSVYLTETEASLEDRNAAIAKIGRAIKEALAL